MRNWLGALAVLASCFLAPIAISARPAPEAIGCGDGQSSLAGLQPLEPGPLRLARVHCLRMPNSPFSVSPPQLSPDGRRYFAYDPIRGLWIGQLAGTKPPAHLEGRLSVPGFGYSQVLPFAWSGDSRTVWAVRQRTMVPNGFALSAVSPATLSLDGFARTLSLPPAAERLDGLIWVGRDGLAVGEFDTKGGYYRPERTDVRPRIAIVDAARGRLLREVNLSDLPAVKPEARVSAIDAQIQGRRVHAVFAIGGAWFDWHQGQAPRQVRLGAAHRFTLAADGKTAVMLRGLSATGVICERDPRCPAPTPVTGRIAERIEIATGKTLWSINGTATHMGLSQASPAVSPDGRYALIPLPAGDAGREQLALVAMQSGRILQRVPGPFTSFHALGFGHAGRTAWVSGGSRIVFYDVTR